MATSNKSLPSLGRIITWRFKWWRWSG